jgi:hypothetical protein
METNTVIENYVILLEGILAKIQSNQKREREWLDIIDGWEKNIFVYLWHLMITKKIWKYISKCDRSMAETQSLFDILAQRIK